MLNQLPNYAQRAIATAAKNAATCRECYITADLQQHLRRGHIEYGARLEIIPCAVHQNAFSDALRPETPEPVPPRLRIEGHQLGKKSMNVEFKFPKGTVGKSARIWSEPFGDWWPEGWTIIHDLKANTVHIPFAFDVKKAGYRIFAEVIE